MKVDVCHTLSTEIIQIDLPEQFVKDLDHVVIINGGEAFQLKSTIPDEIKKKNDLRKQFEDNEFEYLRTSYYLDLDENADPDDFEEDFINHAKNLVYGNYPELQAIIDESASNESIYHTICIHFAVYAVQKNKEEKLQKKNAEQQTDRCYAKDFAKRLINLFRQITFSNPSSITTFSQELNDIERFMNSDPRRHAGFDKLFAGINVTVRDLANAFMTGEGETKINLVKAFQEAAEGEDNPDRQNLIAKIDKILNTTIAYYENYIESIDKIERDIGDVQLATSASYCAVARGLVAGFVNATDTFLKEAGSPDISPEQSTKMKEAYKIELGKFMSYFDDLMSAYDDISNNELPDDVYSKNLVYIWTNIDRARSSDTETWPTDLARLLYDQYQDLFSSLPEKVERNSR